MPGDGYDFSFSGLKTSVVNRVRKAPDAATADVAALVPGGGGRRPGDPGPSAAADVGARALCLAGGVAANSLLRARIEQACPRTASGRSCPPGLCTDNAAMVAAAGTGGSPGATAADSIWAPTRTCAWSRRADPAGRAGRWHSGDAFANRSGSGYR